MQGAAAATGPGSGTNRSIPDLKLDLVWIASGSFLMGSANAGPADERPVTQVKFSRGFWLGRTEVTQAQWAVLMGGNPSGFKGDDLPVDQVSWDGAMEFCSKLTEREQAAGRLPAGYVFTLPTEAQWEYSCRAGTVGDYAGDLDAMGWYDKNSDSRTHTVGTKQPNAWGLCDMHGNVWEWCLDWKADYPGGSVTDYAGAASGTNRLKRGGGWRFEAVYCRSAYRIWSYPDCSSDGQGFRLALVASTSAP
jgi:formylglycine-generating enzyme required for sulfatase activity